MPENKRVQRWREEKRQRGMKAITIWLTAEEELRLKDLALQWHCSPSTLVQQALAQFSPPTAPSVSCATDTPQIRELIRAELAAVQAEQPPVTDTVTEAVTATLARDLPGLVRQLVEGLALEALGLPVTETNGNVTDTEAFGLPATDTSNGSPTDTLPPESPVASRPGRVYTSEPGNSLVAERADTGKRGGMRRRIVALLQEHPEGLSADQIRVYLNAEKPLGDTLQGMRRQGKVRTRGAGKGMRYVAGD
jgi:hypothetical protein